MTAKKTAKKTEPDAPLGLPPAGWVPDTTVPAEPVEDAPAPDEG